MRRDFTQQWHHQRNVYGIDWTSWLGGPMLYDGGFFVNRTVEEHRWSDMIFRKRI